MLAHGEREAVKAHQAAVSMFGIKSISNKILPASKIPRDVTSDTNIEMPQTIMKTEEFSDGMAVFKLFFKVGLTKSGGASRKLIEQGGAYLNEVRLNRFDYMVRIDDFTNGEIVLRAGKKRYHRVRIENKV